MRLASYLSPTGPAAAVMLGEQLVPTAPLGAPASARELLATLTAAELEELAARAEELDDPRLALAQTKLAAPVPDAEKIICIGLNYRDHAEETGQEIPQSPMWFAKFRNSLCGSGAAVLLPAAHPDHVDYEAELAVVIGTRARNVSPSEARAHIAGVMPFNDVSARDLQFQNPLWTSGKAIDTFAPCGPALVTLADAGDLAALKLATRINGETVQEGTTANLIFGPDELIAWLSRTITLEPGDIIATGTPAGVGAAKGLFLRPGDEVEVEIEGIGTLSNEVRAE